MSGDKSLARQENDPQNLDSEKCSRSLAQKHFLKRFFFWSERLVELFCAFLLWAWFFGFLLFDTFLTGLTPSKLYLPVDAVVVFTGSEGRVQTGISLLKRGLAAQLLISGVKSQRQTVLTKEDIHLPITLGYTANNTLENVEETVGWLTALGFSSVYLVTADYHIPRSLFLLKKKMPLGRFYPYPLKTSPEKRLKYAFAEYHKLAACVVFFELLGSVHEINFCKFLVSFFDLRHDFSGKDTDISGRKSLESEENGPQNLIKKIPPQNRDE